MNDDSARPKAEHDKPTSTEHTPQRRRHPRFSFVADVEIYVRADDAEQQQQQQQQRFTGRSKDISMGGMFIVTQAAIEVGMPMTIDIFPEDGQPLRLHARVVHVRGEGFGCIFTRLSPEANERLRRWLGRCGGLAPVSGTIGGPG